MHLIYNFCRLFEFVVFLLLVTRSTILCSVAQDLNGMAFPGQPTSSAGTNNTEEQEYVSESAHLMIIEASDVAQKLALEKGPIRESDVLEVYVPPKAVAQRLHAVGTITTSNYIYFISGDNKLCFIHSTHQDEEIGSWYKTALLPISKKDSIGACEFAVECLKRLSVDVDELNRSFHIYLRYETIEGKPSEFVPIYWVYWSADKNLDSVASVRFFGPTKKILQIRVENPAYLLRKPVR
jgi:hypothetical protein